jgi:hypothetical protein
LQPDGKFYSLADAGALVSYIPEDSGSLEAFGGPSSSSVTEGTAMELTSTPAFRLKNHQDYVARARYIAEGSKHPQGYQLNDSSSVTEIKRTINKLSRAVSELRIGMLGK